MKNEQSSESQVDNLRDGTYLRIGKKIIPSIPEINTVECKHNIYFDARCKLCKDLIEKHEFHYAAGNETIWFCQNCNRLVNTELRRIFENIFIEKNSEKYLSVNSSKTEGNENERTMD